MMTMVHMSPRLQKDVDRSEEAELQRLEHRLPHGGAHVDAEAVQAIGSGLVTMS